MQLKIEDSSQIGPGLGGFLVMFFLALAVVLLMRSMVGHLRKVRYSPDPAAGPQPAEAAPRSVEAAGTDPKPSEDAGQPSAGTG